MSEERRDELRGHRITNPNARVLPPIREVFAKELDLPPKGPYSFDDVNRALPRSETTGSPSLWYYSRDSGMDEQRVPYRSTPIQPHPRAIPQTYSEDSPGSRRHSSVTPASSFPRASNSDRDTTHRSEHHGYSYSVLRTSGPSGALVNATPPSERPQGILRQTAATAQAGNEDPNKKHKCDYCGKRFSMPSHLEIHTRTHTAVRPYTCEWPNCDRTFSVRSNMMRHYRSHSSANPQESERSRYTGNDISISQETRDASSRHSRDSSSSASGHHYPTSSQYYSSRHK